MKKVVLALFLPLLALTVQAQEAGEPQFLVSSQGNVLLLSPKQHIIDGQILSLNASANGRYAHIFRLNLNPNQYADLVQSPGENLPTFTHTLVDTVSKRSVELKIDPAQERIQQELITPQGTLVCQLDIEDRTVIRIYGFNGSSVNLYEGKAMSGDLTAGDTVAEFAVDPTTGHILLMEDIFSKSGDGGFSHVGSSRLTVFNHLGQPLNRWQFGSNEAILYPATNRLPRPVVQINDDMKFLDSTGRNLIDVQPINLDPKTEVVGSFAQKATKDGMPSMTWLAFTSAYDFAVEEEPEQNTSQRVPAVIGTNITHTEVANNVVLFADSGGLHRIDLVPIDPDAYQRLLAEKAKQDAMMKSKHAALGLLIYASDYDDLFPPSSNWQELVNPYVKNSDITANFNYLLNGEELANIAKPAETVLGIVSTPYGEAIAYADGHVIWRPNPSKASLLLTLLADPKRTPQMSK